MPFFQNAVKYTKFDSVLNIDYEKEAQDLLVHISMTSLHIRPEEAQKIFQRSVSGDEAHRRNKQGKGLGLYHAKKLFGVSRADISVSPGDLLDAAGYSKNTFNISIPTNIHPRTQVHDLYPSVLS
jgi:signal transduction histidine kinase